MRRRRIFILNSKLVLVMTPEVQLTMQLLDEHINGILSLFVSRESLQCLELAAIGHGCEPYLTGDSWSSRWLLSLATALRGLDQPELERLLTLLISDDELRNALAESLVLLRKSPDAPVQNLVPLVIDEFWAIVWRQQRGQTLPAAYYPKDGLSSFEEYKRRKQSEQPAKD